MYLLESLSKLLKSGNERKVYHALNTDVVQPLRKELSDSDAVVIACPLYVDSIPSNLLEVLSALEKELGVKTRETKVYLLVNNGFYDAIQNSIAIDLLWNWCDKSGLNRGYAIGVGAGGMVQMFPVGQGPSANLGKALRKFADDIENGRSADPVFVEPNFPRALYQMAAHIGWRKGAKANGLKVSDLKRTL